MGCKWPKLETNSRVVPIDKSTNQSVPALDDVVVGQQNTGSLHVILKQPVSNIVDHSKQNNEHKVINGSISQSIPILLENSKPLLPDESTKHEEIGIVHHATDDPTSTFVNNSMQTFEQMSTHETTNERLSQRISSETPNKRLLSADSQQQEGDHYNEKLHDEIISISDRSIVEENIDSVSDITNEQVEEKINDSIQDPTISENLFSKRVDSTTSTKHSLSSHDNNDQNHLEKDDIVSISDTEVDEAMINALPAAANDHVEIIDADPEAFNTLFIKQRQDAIDNPSYRSTIKSWKPNSLQQLNGIIETLSKGKSLIDCHWIIFYWIACNIEYDAVSYLNHNIPDQSVEEVFRTKKGVCAGYSRLYKYLCDKLGIKCEEIHGYAKGYGFDNREEDALSKKNHAWNTVEINHHWYLIDSTWGTGHLNKQKTFERQLDCFYFFARPHQMIYHHLPEDDKWQLLRTPIKMTQYLQMPKVHSSYFNLNLELISPLHQAHASLIRDKSYALILIRAPNDVRLIGNLQNSKGKKIEGGEQVYYDQRKCLWKFKFAPDQDGLFKANIFGKKTSDTGDYSGVISFKIEATQIPSPALSYPYTGQIFHDLNLKVEAPQNCSTVPWPENASYVEILIRTPDDVQLSCSIQYNNVIIKNGSLAQFDNDKSIWQLLFAPECTGQHELIVFAKRLGEEKSECALKFHLNVTQLYQPMKFPTIYGKFDTLKCRIYEPLNGVLKKSATVPIHCLIPGALEVDLTVDSEWIKTEGYQDPILKRNVTVGSKEVTIYAKYGQKTSCDALVKYSVQ